MGLKGRLSRLQAALRDDLGSFELADGSRHWYDPAETAKELFLYSCDCLRAAYGVADRPEPPEIVRAVAGVKDRRAALEQASAASPMDFFAFEREPLAERGELVHRSFVAGQDADSEPVPDLSEQA